MPRVSAKAIARAATRPFPLDQATWFEVVRSLKFTPRQGHIVELLLRGMRDKQIADELGITLPTVRTHVSRIFQRLDVFDRVELVLLILEVTQDILKRR